MPSLSLGLGLSRTRPLFRGLLDQYAGAAEAYSLRALSSSFKSQPLVKVRRTVGSPAEADFTEAEINNGTLATWVGAGDGFVTTWYDQSGDAQNATQTTAANQPIIVSSGTVVTEGGLPAIQFNGATTPHFLNLTGNGSSQPIEIFSVSRYPSQDSKFRYFFDRSGATSGARIIVGATNGNLYRSFAGSVIDGTAYSTSQILRSDLFNSTSSALRVNASATNSGDAGTNGFGAQLYCIGADATAGTSTSWQGTISEFILYDADVSANRAAIEANINDRYSIY